MLASRGSSCPDAERSAMHRAWRDAERLRQVAGLVAGTPGTIVRLGFLAADAEYVEVCLVHNISQKTKPKFRSAGCKALAPASFSSAAATTRRRLRCRRCLWRRRAPGTLSANLCMRFVCCSNPPSRTPALCPLVPPHDPCFCHCVLLSSPPPPLLVTHDRADRLKPEPATAQNV